MFSLKLLIASLFVVSSARHVPWENQRKLGYLYGVDKETHPDFFGQDLSLIPDRHQPGYLARSRRQAQGSLTLNSDGGIGMDAKVTLINDDKNILSAIGSVNLDSKMQATSSGLGLTLDNVDGYGLTVTKQNVPELGDQLTGAAKLNVFHDDIHNLDANVFVTRTRPNIQNLPNYNTVGGGFDYTYKNMIGASLGMSSTPFLGRQDYSVMGYLNLYRTPTSSLDFSGGVKKYDTPFMSSGWQPTFGFTFGKSF